MDARIPYYNDPLFRQRIMGMTAPTTQLGPTSPFAATQNAVASRLFSNRNMQYGNALNLAQADAQRQAAQFNQAQKWNLFGNQTNRAANEIGAQEQLAYGQRQINAERNAAKKSKRRGLFGTALGTLGGAAGTFLGGPVGGMVGYGVGNTIGGSL